MLLLLVFFARFPHIAMVAIFCGFAIDGLVRWLYHHLQLERRQVAPESQDFIQ
jgi:hypothetical protein